MQPNLTPAQSNVWRQALYERLLQLGAPDAIAATMAARTDSQRTNPIYTLSFAMAVLFTWDNQPEGYDFWHQLWSEARDRAL